MSTETAQMVQPISFRKATQDDCSDLAVLSDAASRRLTSHLWDGVASPGQSGFEVGREYIRTNADHFIFYENWHVATRAGRVVGAINGYVIPVPTEPEPDDETPGVLVPFGALKSVAQGTWYLSVAAAFPEFRGQGVGTALLERAEEITRQKQIDRLTLMVGSFNTGAYRLYDRFGFREWERRPFVPFSGSDPEGEMILMVKDVS